MFQFESWFVVHISSFDCSNKPKIGFGGSKGLKVLFLWNIFGLPNLRGLFRIKANFALFERMMRQKPSQAVST